ncbi:hypothetical protein EV195_101484 [Tenacibaculum skagerrakense]|uniref:Phosphate-selective porin O/P n=1 Tax=Tenacibaculum skagerrakense TaxID=186571 RepID=A0A4R2P2G1_9FLAO|nr:hypothetical protein [Tenacibaculum skagerrakense]TCP28308.1 hypothetical protein EV195_101484 [Tenacibaculum skagerrakense]
MHKLVFIILGIAFLTDASAQHNSSAFLKNGIDKPSMLPIHHFGMFSSRINQNFKVRPVDKNELQVSIASANTFNPFVEKYIPKDEATRNEMRQLIWYNRHFFIDQETTPAEYSTIVVDAVFKNIRIDFTTKLTAKSDLTFTLRSYLVTKGLFPFSTITSDNFIEWFHSNIAGGEDPFGRRYYGLNQVNVRYQDKNGRVLTLKDGEFIFGGIETNYFYYPSFPKLTHKNIFMSFGAHMGINTSEYNPSLDFGFSSNLTKEWRFKNNTEFRFGVGLAVLRKNIMNFGNTVELGDLNFLGSLESMIEYTKYTAKKNYHSWGINYQRQTSYNNPDEANYYQLVGKWQEIHSGWSNGFEKLTEHQSAWSLLYTYGTPKTTLNLYLKQDLYLNNSPDIQTGIALKFPLVRSK